MISKQMLAVCAVLALAIAGCSGDDKKKEGGDPAKGGDGDKDKGASEDKVGEVKGSAVAGSKSLATGGTDWTKLDTKTDAPAKKAGEVKATDVPRTGIAQTSGMKGLTAFAGNTKATGFRVAYAPTEKYGHFRDAFMKEQLFEKIANTLNSTIKMPNVVDIQMVDCGTVNAFYDPNSSRIIMCYELLEYYVDMFKPVSKSNDELGNAVIGATFFAFFHELGHGLIHQLELPATGQEEDAVDELSTLILMEGGDDGVAAAMAGAKWFAMEQEKEDKTGQKMPLFDEHGLNGKRFYNVACLVYGSDPTKYQAMVTNNYLPEPRAVRCSEEFKRKSRAWENLLKSHMVQGETASGQQEGGGYEAPPVQVPEVGEKPPEPEAPPVQPATGDVTQLCDQLVQHVLGILVRAEMEAAAKQGPEAAEAKEQELRSNVSIIYPQLVQQCVADPPKPNEIQCVAKSTTVKDLQGCGL
jgi:hypothetical protein